MDNKILYGPSYSLLVVTLQQGEAVLATSGTMVSMSPTVEMDTAAQGGLLQGLKRSVLGGESFFINTFTATSCERYDPRNTVLPYHTR